MNPLGWKSAVFNLARTADLPMADVADNLLAGVRTARASGAIAPSAQARLVGDELIGGLGSSREIYAEFLTAARAGADDATLASHLDYLAGNLKATEQVRLSGTAMGHVRGARTAADQVVDHLRRGVGPTQEPTFDAMWNLRYHLDEGWNALGTAKVMGELRGVTSVT